jgi:hypothetical protein
MFTALSRSWYVVPFCKPVIRNGDDVEAGERAVNEEPLSVEYS